MRKNKKRKPRRYIFIISVPFWLDGCGGVVRLRPWCTLAYWELRQRVGRLFPVTQPSVAIFSDSLATAGAAATSSMVVPTMPLDRQCNATSLCLSALTSQRPPETDAVRRTRQKVGLGMIYTHWLSKVVFLFFILMVSLFSLFVFCILAAVEL